MSTARDRWIAILLLLVMSGGIYLFTAQVLVPPRGLRFDFMPRYIGGQAVWQGINPYGETVTQSIQITMFGNVLPPEADQQRMAYPAYAAVILAPLLMLPSHVAVSLWASFQLIAVLLSPVLIIVLNKSRLHPIAFLLLLVGTVFLFRYPINLYIVAQFTGTMLLGMVIALWFVLRGLHVAAGITLAIVTLPPTIMLGYAVVFLGGLALVGQWRGAVAYVVTMAVLMLIPMLTIGWWVPAWIENLLAYAEYSYPIWAPELLSPIFRPLPIAGVVACGLWIWNRYRVSRMPARLMDLSIAAILISLLAVPQTGNYYLVLLILPLVVIAVRGFHAQRPWLIAGVGLACISPWGYLALRDLVPNLDALLLPLHVGLLWLFTLRDSAVTPAYSRLKSKANA